MPKRKKIKAFPSAVKISIIFILVVALTWLISTKTVAVLESSDYFNVKTIIIDPSLQFIDKRDLKKLKRKNIFKVDLKAVQRRLSSKYPQISDLKVIRRFPGQIYLTAKKRLPFAQMRVKERTVILDDSGVVLSIKNKEDSHLPLILGAYTNVRFSLGLPVTYTSVKAAIKILRAMDAYGAQSSYKIERVDVQNLSKIGIYLSKDLMVFVDSDKVNRKIKILNLVLSQGQLDLKTVKYIDLRFKEPIIGKK